MALPDRNNGLRELALFAGAGGGILGGYLLGWRTVCAVEIEDYPRRVLLARQRDGILPRFPIWDDIKTFDGREWRGRVDVISGGFPCQDISCAGKGEGITGSRSGLWGEMARIIREVGPRFVFVENSPMLTVRGLGRVLGDLAALGYDARWGVVGAVDAGAPHKRDRIWIVGRADSNVRRQQERQELNGEAQQDTTNRDASRQHSDGLRYTVANADQHGLEERLWQDRKPSAGESCKGGTEVERSGWWQSEPAVGRVAHGIPNRVDRLKALGNAQVPAVARLAWEILSAGIEQ